MARTQRWAQLSPRWSQEPEGGSLGTRDIKPKHTVTNNYSMLFASGKVCETAKGRQVKEDLTARLGHRPHIPPCIGVGVWGSLV